MKTLYTPLSLIAENAVNTDSTISLLAKHESTISNYFNKKSEFVNEYYEAKMKYWRAILESYNDNKLIDNAREEFNSFIKDSKRKYSNFINESIAIHGEIVDADTIFDNKDPNDFNRTEWVDLTLESTYAINRSYNELIANRFYRECSILASDITPSEKLNAIIRLNEADGFKSKTFIGRAIDFIKKIWAKFLEKLYSIGKDNTAYLEKYKKIIMEQRPKSQDIKIKDFNTAIRRLVEAKINYFDYNLIKDKLATEEDAQNWVKTELNKHRGATAYSDSILDSMKDYIGWCKAFFCVAPECEPIQINTANTKQCNMTDIYNFLHDYKKIENTLKQDLDNLTKTANAMASAAEALSGKQQPQEGYTWSDVYNTYINESVLYEFEKVQTVNNDNTQNNQDTTAAGNISNGNKAPENAEQNVQGAQAGGHINEFNEVKVHADNYIKAVKGLFAAKMTAVEAIRSELMALVRDHVNNFINKETQGTTAKAVGTNYGTGQQQTNKK